MKEYKTSFEYRLRKSREAGLRRSGRSTMVPKQPVMDRLAEIMRYVPLAQLADRINVPLVTLYNWRTHDAATVHRMYADRVMAYQLEGDATSSTERIRGSQRIYRGLACRGFGMRLICDMTGMSDSNFKNIVCDGPHTKRGIGPEAYRELVRVAGKLETQNPYDLAATSKSVNVVKGKAKGSGWIDIGAWDLDTVHRADAQPDITGQCGRMAGVLIHLRQGEDLCPRCVYVTKNPHGHNKIDPFKLHELTSDGSRTHAEIAQLLGVTKDLVSQYAQYLSTEERRVHSLSMVDKTAKIAYCDFCRDQVPLYVSTGSKLVCSNGVKKHREEKGHAH